MGSERRGIRRVRICARKERGRAISENSTGDFPARGQRIEVGSRRSGEEGTSAAWGLVAGGAEGGQVGVGENGFAEAGIQGQCPFDAKAGFEEIATLAGITT